MKKLFLCEWMQKGESVKTVLVSKIREWNQAHFGNPIGWSWGPRNAICAVFLPKVPRWQHFWSHCPKNRKNTHLVWIVWVRIINKYILSRYSYRYVSVFSLLSINLLNTEKKSEIEISEFSGKIQKINKFTKKEKTANSEYFSGKF